MEIKDLIGEFSKTRPGADIIVGYGSKVKAQANDKGIPKQIDLIFGVDDALEWHKSNHEMNSSDYKSELGYKLLPLYGNLGPKINYLSYIPFENYMFKIGIVETENLLMDLINWHNFFLAGRFQKPIEIIKGTAELNSAVDFNRINALKTALLASGKQTISEQELFEILCSLSFVGDWRQILHIENKNKVKNIVEGSFDELHNIYSALNRQYYTPIDDRLLAINYEVLLNSLDTLPYVLKLKIVESLSDGIAKKEADSELLKKLKKTIMNHFSSMNLGASAIQPIKGLALNGAGKSLTYVKQKLAKK